MRHLLFGTWLRLCLCGSQAPLSVGKETFYLDLFFDQVRRHCYFVIKLMVGKFKPEDAGLDRVMLPGIAYQQDAVIRMEAADELCLSQVEASEVYRSHTGDALRCLYPHHMRGGPAASCFDTGFGQLVRCPAGWRKALHSVAVGLGSLAHDLQRGRLPAPAVPSSDDLLMRPESSSTVYRCSGSALECYLPQQDAALKPQPTSCARPGTTVSHYIRDTRSSNYTPAGKLGL